MGGVIELFGVSWLVDGMKEAVLTLHVNNDTKALSGDGGEHEQQPR